MHYTLQKGFTSINGQVEILDTDTLCYVVKNYSSKCNGFLTISLELLNEFVYYFEKHPYNTSAHAREDLV